jgi:hypothetical protein
MHANVKKTDDDIDDDNMNLFVQQRNSKRGVVVDKNYLLLDNQRGGGMAEWLGT